MNISSDNVKAGAMLVGLAVVGYVAYRAMKVGEGAAATVSETINRASTAIGDAATYVTDVSSRVDDYTGWVRNFWTGLLEPPVTEGAYPEPGPVRAAESAAATETIRVRYEDPSASFEQLAAPHDPFYNYGTSPSGFGTDSVIGSLPPAAAPDSFVALSDPLIIVTPEYWGTPQ